MYRQLIAAAAVFLASCASAYRPIYSPPSVAVGWPALGVVTEAFPGDPMLTQGTQREYEALVATAPFSVGGFSLPAGEYLKEGTDGAAEFNTAEYDLSDSRTIAYKGALIEIVEATNQVIRYRVLRNFNAAQE